MLITNLVINSQAVFHQSGYSITHQYGDNSEMTTRMKEIRQAKKISLAKLEEKTGISAQQLNRLEKGERRWNEDNSAKVAAALGCGKSYLMGEEDTATMIPVVAYVGAGAEIRSVDDHAKGNGMDEVECPPGVNPRNVVAVRVKGDSMLPVFQDGWIVYYNERHNIEMPAIRQDWNEQKGWQVAYASAGNEPLSEFIHKPCVVKLKDGRTLLKVLKRGSAAGRYTLVSHNSIDIEDVELEWVAKIIFIKTA